MGNLLSRVSEKVKWIIFFVFFKNWLDPENGEEQHVPT